MALSMLIAVGLMSPLSGGPSLSVAAATSPRPVECLPQAAARADKPTVWSRARRPALDEYCSHLAIGYGRLLHNPSAAQKAAKRALKARPKSPAGHVLLARSLFAQNQLPAAWLEFQTARQLDPRAVELPDALHDFAVVAVHTGHVKEGAEAYRALIPRAGLLGSTLRRQRCYIEAAHAIMDARGKPGLEEAIGYLGEARRRASLPLMRPFVYGSLAVAYGRAGRADESGAARKLADRVGPVERASGTQVAPTMLYPALLRRNFYGLLAVMGKDAAAQRRAAAAYKKACSDCAWR